MEDLDFTGLFEQLGHRLRAARERLGLSQEDMISFGFSARHWQQVEKGRAITLKTLGRAAKALGLKMSDLLLGLDKRIVVKIPFGTPRPKSRGPRSTKAKSKAKGRASSKTPRP